MASLSQGRTAAVQCGLFTYKSVLVIFEPPCTTHSAYRRPKFRSSIPGSKKRIRTDNVVHPARSPKVTRGSLDQGKQQGIKLTFQLDLMMRLKMWGATLPPHLS